MFRSFRTHPGSQWFALAAVVVIAGGIGWSLLHESSSTEESELRITELGFFLNQLDDFTITAQYGTLQRGEVNLSAEKEGDILRIKVIPAQTAEAAEHYTKGQSLLFSAQYDSRLPPYPEFLTNQTGCAERFLPERIETEYGPYYLVHADERFNYGLCADDLVRYKAGFGLLYCPESGKIVQLEYFTDEERSFDDVDRIMRSFTCAPNT